MGCRYMFDGAVELHVHPLGSSVAGQGICDSRRPALKANLGRVERLRSPADSCRRVQYGTPNMKQGSKKTWVIFTGT